MSAIGLPAGFASSITRAIASRSRPGSSYHAEPRFLSVEEYLELEEQSVNRHEYVGGLVYAMTGSTRRHNAISLNLAAACHRHLARGSPCQAFINDVKVRLVVNQKDIFYYPDVMVACDPSEAKDMEKVWVKEPKLIVEVLSPSTQSIDRREKLQNYSQIDTLEEYVLVAQRTPEVTFYRRDSDWEPVVVRSPEGVAEFQSISLFLPMTRLYADALPL